MADILEKRLRKGAEKMDSGGVEFPSGDVIKATVERLESELKAKGYDEALKGEPIGVRGSKFAKIAFDVLADVLEVEKKELFMYLILKPFLQVWENAPEPVKDYYRYKYRELEEVVRVAKSI